MSSSEDRSDSREPLELIDPVLQVVYAKDDVVDRRQVRFRGPMEEASFTR